MSWIFTFKERYQNTFFNQHLNADIFHPLALDIRATTNVTNEKNREGSCSKINKVQRHAHSDHCNRNKGKCERENAKNAAKGLNHASLELKI